MATHLNTQGYNYNNRADQSKHLDALVLKSQLIDLPTSFAIGCVRGNQLILSPLDEAVQMRPHLGHLDTAAKQVKQEEDLGTEDKKPSFITVQVQRRETERQAEQRLASFAHISQTEADEKWKTLDYASPDSEVASGVWATLMEPQQQATPLASMPCTEYLSTLTAGAVQSEQVSSNPPQGTHTGRDASVTGQALQSPAVAGRAGAAAAAMGASIQQPDEAAPMQLDDQPVQLVEPAAQKALPAALMVMFKKNSIVNLQDVRDWLSAFKEAGAAQGAASADNKSLHNALVKTGLVTHVKNVYALTKAANGGPADALRGVLLNILRDKPNVRRADVFDAARAEGLNVSDSVYQKVMKDLCTSKGNVWTLKVGA
ncbi:hypothetical protein ABBQ32_009040 [Trebouxia sp. C0010 RCD-2024]